MTSPFAPHLGSNYCPRDEDEPCLRLEHLDDEIEERDTLRGYVDAHRALMSPIRRLPLDTIEDIFMACLPADRNCVMSAQEVPVLLGRICSSWRAISLSQPQLWSRLHIAEPKVLPDPLVAQRLELTTAWLRRSGDCPLSISLESHPYWSSSPSPLIPFSSRWRNIRLAALSRLTENDDQISFVPQPGGFLHGPSLTRFSFVQSHLTYLLLFPAWDMGHLQTPQLQICIFVVHDFEDGSVADDIRVVECPSLRSPLHTAQCLLKHLSMANLQEFKLKGGRDFSISSTVLTENSLGSSLTAFPRLNSISIDTESFTKPSLMDFSLYITEPMDSWQVARPEPDLDDEVLFTLAAHCPALRELTILNCRHVTDDALLRFIIAGTPALRRIQVEFERERQVDVSPSIQLFVDNGLECNTMYRSPSPPSTPPPSPPPPPPRLRSSPWEGLPDASSAPNF
ncbi:hypothetical protein K438DRAFT_1821460 [Mycena galopus ATCC 62051]|nr:hypothetical protein K438DRAFT_1821460 [Mycena galopus ATCC 62051]